MRTNHSALVQVRKQPEIFICSLVMRRVYSALLLVKGTAESAMISRQASQNRHRLCVAAATVADRWWLALVEIQNRL